MSRACWFHAASRPSAAHLEAYDPERPRRAVEERQAVSTGERMPQCRGGGGAEIGAVELPAGVNVCRSGDEGDALAARWDVGIECDDTAVRR